MSETSFYDALSEDYDRFVDWEARLAFEMPFFRALFERRQVRRVLDVACGTGRHAIAFAEEGYEATAADPSQAMVDRARANVAAAKARVNVHKLGFGGLGEELSGPYDAITCLGNSLPHLLTEEAMVEALVDMASVVSTKGILVVQNRNFDRVLARHERFMPPEVHRSGDEEWIFVRFYDLDEEKARFNMVRLHRRGSGSWGARIEQTQLRAWQHRELEPLLFRSGFKVLSALGGYDGGPFARLESPDLLLVAERFRDQSRPGV